MIPRTLLLASVATLAGLGAGCSPPASEDAPGASAPAPASQTSAPASPAPEAGLAVGDPAPDWALPGSDGAVHRLSDLRGRHVVLAFFPKAFTGG